MLAREDETDEEVRLEDQKRINEFGRLNTTKLEYEMDLVVAEKALSQLEAAEEEVMLAVLKNPRGCRRILAGSQRNPG